MRKAIYREAKLHNSLVCPETKVVDLEESAAVPPSLREGEGSEEEVGRGRRVCREGG